MKPAKGNGLTESNAESDPTELKPENKEKKEDVALNNNEQEQEYVLVTDCEDGERIELPTDPADRSLGVTTLSHAFPGAHGLKYRNPKTGASRALIAIHPGDYPPPETFCPRFQSDQKLNYKNYYYSQKTRVDHSSSKFLPPSDGWADKLFYAIYQNANGNHGSSSRATGKHSVAFRTVGQVVDLDDLRGDQTTKRRKLMDESDSSDTEIGRSGSIGQNSFKVKRVELPQEQTVVAQRSPDEPRCTDLIVLGLPYRTSIEKFKEYFEQFGSVVACELKRDVYGNSKGFGFVQFMSYDAQLRVLAKTSHNIDGRKCQVRIPSSKTKEAQTVTDCKLFVGRVSEKTTIDDLQRFFTSEAKKILADSSVVDVFIPKPFRSFAFITLSHPSVVRGLIEIGDFVLDGVSMNVLAATPKDGLGGLGDMSPVSPRLSSSQSIRTESPYRTPKADSNTSHYYPEPPESYFSLPTSSGKVGGSLARNRYTGDNRFSPGYMSTRLSSSGTVSLISPPQSSRNTSIPNAMSSAPFPNNLHGSSQALASEIDALNLNNPGIVNAAWEAFWTTVSQGKTGSPQ